MQPFRIVLCCIHNFPTTKCQFNNLRFEFSDEFTSQREQEEYFREIRELNQDTSGQ